VHPRPDGGAHPTAFSWWVCALAGAAAAVGISTVGPGSFPDVVDVDRRDRMVMAQDKHSLARAWNTPMASLRVFVWL